MANGKKPSRDELKSLQEDLGPYYQQPLLPRRRDPPSREITIQEIRRHQSNTPESKRQGTKRHGSSSRDSTPNRSTRPRPLSREQTVSQEVSTPKRSPRSEPPRSEPQRQQTPKQQTPKQQTPKQQTPKQQTPRQQTPRQQTPRQQTPKQDSAKQEPPGREMSQRNRSGRGSNRNNGNSHGEEVQIWDNCKGQVGEIVTGINAENDSLADLVNMDKQVGTMDLESIPGESLQQMESLCRTGVRHSEANMAALKALSDQLKVLRAVVVAKEQAEAQAAGPSKRQARDSAATASSLYDFDGAGDSPVPSPMAGSSRKYGDRSSNRDRDSMPPKADSVEPQGSSGSAAGSNAGANSNKSKVIFQKGDSVAFKPRAVNSDQMMDWILGEVAQVLGEGKSRRYKVLDIEPDDQSKQKEYRSSASSMISISPESQASTLKDWEQGKVVLALYPNTTTFYKAEVHNMGEGGKVNLKFEGENDSSTLQQVERRFVIEYRA